MTETGCFLNEWFSALRRYLCLMPESRKLLGYHALTVILSTVLMGGKFLAWHLTGSNAVLTDALESIVNVLAGMFAWYSLWLSLKPRDHEHPYGHGKIEFISASIEGTLILIAGLGITFKSGWNLVYPQQLKELEEGVWILVAAGAVNFIMGTALVNMGRKQSSLTLKSNGKHLLSDAWSSAGLLAGVVVVWMTGWVWMDNLLGIGFGLFIGNTGFGILRKSVAGIMDEADFDLLSELVDHLNENRRDDWIDIHNLRVIQYGNQLHIDCHVTLPWYYSLKESHDVISEIDRIVFEKYEKVELFIHMDPCIPESCRICSLEQCDVRKHPFEERLRWNLKQVLTNSKHGTG